MDLIEELFVTLELQVVPREVMHDLTALAKAMLIEGNYENLDQHRELVEWLVSGKHPQATSIAIAKK